MDYMININKAGNQRYIYIYNNQKKERKRTRDCKTDQA